MMNGTQCKLFHHQLLHPTSASNISLVGVASVSYKEAVLPVVLVDIGNHDNHQLGNLLFDSGAQISLVRMSLAENLKLNGKEVVTTITNKVGGEEEELRTKIYQVRIRPLNKSQFHTVLAVGIPCICEELAVVNLTSIAQNFKIHPVSLYRGSGSVDLLLRIDLYAKMHCGQTIEAGNLVARQSPLGWVIFGAIPGEPM
ncbi:uncharacterized protein LOC119745029 [Patiria miniata]|uniref:Peptidase aspartic putative domain-containing protein n=1 Tax=Patiria miniata TaxID=46514 RepID=A0A914B733_PATMI|nr:uncharacterized protein LOC119740129 [Patiria miniata]XP_038071863.1 uncharacterized protein LOC119740587 [Patiria miniata]XP_038077181.1 uncharacterized protein LOC119745029 [Patiria miniata]